MRDPNRYPSPMRWCPPTHQSVPGSRVARGSWGMIPFCARHASRMSGPSTPSLPGGRVLLTTQGCGLRSGVSAPAREKPVQPRPSGRAVSRAGREERVPRLSVRIRDGDAGQGPQSPGLRPRRRHGSHRRRIAQDTYLLEKPTTRVARRWPALVHPGRGQAVRRPPAPLTSENTPTAPPRPRRSSVGGGVLDGISASPSSRRS